MKHNPKQITLDLAEWVEIQSELEALRKPADGDGLSEAEQQEATGILLVRALQNPNLFRTVGSEPIDLGKYIATFVVIAPTASGLAAPQIRVKLVRT